MTTISIPSVSWRQAAAAAAALLLLAGVVVGVWLWSDAQQRAVAAAYADALARLGGARGREPTAEERAAAVRDLEAALQRHPSGPLAAQAALELGNVRYAAREWSRARGAWEIAAAQGHSPTLRTLARMGIGYAWEAERNYPKAVEAFRAAAADLKPTDFHYEELLVGLARAQELAGDRQGAIETYRRVLREVPNSARADDIRTRLASLGARP